MTKKITVREGRTEDIPQVARIYREVFPDHLYSILGQGICENYFSILLENEAFGFIVACIQEKVVGVLGIHFDRTVSLSKSWLLHHPEEIIKSTMIRPRFFIKTLMGKGLNFIKTQLFLKNKSNKIVGQTYIKNSGKGEFVAVLETVRRLGVGNMLVIQMTNLGKERGLSNIDVVIAKSNIPSIKNVENLGFIRMKEDPTGQVYYYRYEIKK